MNIKRLISYVTLLGFSHLLLAAEPMIYVVRPGETISEIAIEKIGRPVYSKNGSLQKIKSLNPQIQNFNLIYPGQEIVVGSDGKRFMATEPQSSPPEALQETAAEPEEKKSDPSNLTNYAQYGQFGLQLGFNFSRVDSKDKSSGSESAFISEMSPQLNLSWNYRWTENWSSFANIEAIFETITSDTSTPARTLLKPTGTRKTLEFGARKHWSHNAKSSLSFGAQEKIYSHTPNSNEIQMDRVPVQFLRISHEQVLFQVQKSLGFAEVQLNHLFATSTPDHTIKSGSGGKASLGLRHDFQKFSVETIASYGFSKQESNIVSQTEKYIGGLIGVSWRFEP